MQYKILYRTTHLSTGRFYIGIHETDNLDDGYLGSGLIIRRLLAKYPKNEFQREVLAFCKTREELTELEKEHIQEVYDDLQCLNISLGGDGGNNCLGLKLRDSERYEKLIETNKANLAKGLEIQKNKIASDPEFAEQMREHHRSALLKAGNKGTLAAKTPKAIEKRKETFKKINHQQGERNSQFGTRWVHRGTENRKIKKDEAIPESWELGRKIK